MLTFSADFRFRRQLDTIPTVGSSSWLGSWWAGLKSMTNAVDVIQEGYEKASLELRTFRPCLFAVFQHKSAPFKVATLYQWIVIFGSREHVEEVRRAPDDALSFTDAMHDASHCFLLVKFLGLNVTDSDYKSNTQWHRKFITTPIIFRLCAHS